MILFCRSGSRIARFRSVRCARSPSHSYLGNIIAGTHPDLLCWPCTWRIHRLNLLRSQDFGYALAAEWNTVGKRLLTSRQKMRKSRVRSMLTTSHYHPTTVYRPPTT